jgi:hypothetical protein
VKALGSTVTAALNQGVLVKRIEIETKLNDSRNWLLATYQLFSEEQLHAPLTQSQVDAHNYWSALDHFAHLALIEQDFATMIRRQLTGTANPVGLLQDDRGEVRTRDQIMAIVNARTEAFQKRHHGESLSQVVALTGAARGETLKLLAELTDAQLDETLAGAPWSDGTIGGVIATNADHGRQHWGWMKDAGLQVPSE